MHQILKRNDAPFKCKVIVLKMYFWVDQMQLECIYNPYYKTQNNDNWPLNNSQLFWIIIASSTYWSISSLSNNNGINFGYPIIVDYPILCFSTEPSWQQI